MPARPVPRIGWGPSPGRRGVPAGGGGTGMTKLHQAVRRGDMAPVRDRVRRGADPNERDRQGRTMLHVAVGKGRGPWIAEELVALGCDPGARDARGRSPLDIAAKAGNIPAAAVLLRAGADAATPDAEGLAPAVRLVRARVPHDAIMKLAFSWGEQIEGFVSLRFPELAARLDFARMVPLQSEFAMENLGLVRSDLVRLIPGRDGGPGCLLVIEFQSRPDRDMPVRLMLYASQAILQLRRTNRRAPVPHPLPVVIATGERRWPDGPKSLDGMLEPPPWTRPPGVSLSFDLTDLADPELDLSAPDNPAAVCLRAVRLRHAGIFANLDGIAAAFQDIGRIFRGPKYASLRAVMRAAVLAGTDLEANPGIIPLIQEEGNMSRLAESLNEAMARKMQEGLSQGRSEGRSEGLSQGRSQGRSEGLSQGRSEGRSEGQREGRIQTFSEIAEHRFGPDVAGALRAHLARIGDPDAVRRSGLALLDCASGAEVLARLRNGGHDPGADGP